MCPNGTPRTRYIGSNEAEGQTSEVAGIMRCHSKKQHAAFYAGASDGCQSLFFFWVLLIVKLLKTYGCFLEINVYGQLRSDCRWVISLLHITLDLSTTHSATETEEELELTLGAVIKVLKASVFELGKSDLSLEANSCSDKFF